jgi:hypothetical protein
MTAKFVVTKKAVNKVIDGNGPQCSYMSVEPEGHYGKGINLVIGAAWSDRCSCAFGKEGVKELTS